MDEVEPHPASRSRLIRDLAMRGAQVERDDRQRREGAAAYLLSIARGETDFNFDAARAIHQQREADFG
jgi:hypothetical protein